jgi:hypothetical protein
LVAVVGFFLLRNQLLVPDQPTPTTTSTATEAPVLVTFTVEPTLAPTLTPTLDASASFAPACSADITFPLPDVKITDYACIRRAPYATVTIPDGATFEVQTPNGECTFSGLNSGRQVLSCTGTNFLLVELKVCTPPVIANEDLGKCSADGTFDSTNQCCVAVPPAEAGCTIAPIQLKGCE